MKQYKYLEDTSEIKTSTCSAWEITLPNGESFLELWDPKASIEDVAKNIPRENGTKFLRVDNGRIKIDKILDSYSGDSRELVILDGELFMVFVR